MGHRGPVSKAQVNDLQKIRRAQKHLLSLINSVLTFVRLDAGRVTYDITTVPLDPCLGAMSSLVEPQLEARRLRYAFHGTGSVATLRADSEKVQQILLNLLDNSIKFTPEGGAVSLGATLAGDMVHITVSDSGPGVDSARLEEIFEPFVQAGNASERRQGVGLGLPISRELARGMGGDLVAHRPLMGGGTFVLTLPRGPDRAP
jgi:signal transduction histidine kinase